MDEQQQFDWGAWFRSFVNEKGEDEQGSHKRGAGFIALFSALAFFAFKYNTAAVALLSFAGGALAVIAGVSAYKAKVNGPAQPLGEPAADGDKVKKTDKVAAGKPRRATPK